jgi:hypothetical protein
MELVTTDLEPRAGKVERRSFDLSQPQNLAIEVLRALEVGDGEADVVDALDVQRSSLVRHESPFGGAALLALEVSRDVVLDQRLTVSFGLRS